MKRGIKMLEKKVFTFKSIKFSYNSPAILSFAAISFIALILGLITRGTTNTWLFSVYRSGWLNPFSYVRVFTHVLGHANLEHFTGNMMFVLILGPMLEEKYGTKNILCVMLVTALVTGVVHLILFPQLQLLGASGVVFAFILLSSFTSHDNKAIPITFILVAIIYIGGQIVDGIFVDNNISNLSHILGGIIGAILGFWMNKDGTPDNDILS